MTFSKSLMVACAFSVLGFGVASAQTADPNAAAPAMAAPDAGAAPEADHGSPKKQSMKKKMTTSKTHMKKKAM